MSPKDDRRSPEVLGLLLDRTIQRLGLSRRLQAHAAVEGWDRAVGPEIARRARPLHVSGRTLHVAVENSSWLHQLTLLHDELLGNFRAIAGETDIDQIRFSLGVPPADRVFSAPLPPRLVAPPLSQEELAAIERDLAPIHDRGVAAVLRRILIEERGKQRSASQTEESFSYEGLDT